MSAPEYVDVDPTHRVPIDYATPEELARLGISAGDGDPVHGSSDPMPKREHPAPRPLEELLGRVTRADARALPLEDHVADVVVESPPYFGLRNYGDDAAEIGRASFDDYLVEILDHFRELERVLAVDGLVWLNLGDTRAGSGGSGGDYSSGRVKGRTYKQGKSGLAAGQAIGVPWRVATALQADGWLVLADVVWSKGIVRLRDGVPELVTRRKPENLKHARRPGLSKEYVFLLARTSKARRRFRPSMLDELGDVWTFPPNPERGRKHEAPFPPELVRRCILPTTLPGEIVLDAFAGSGTTLRVCAKHGRQAIGFDLYAEDAP